MVFERNRVLGWGIGIIICHLDIDGDSDATLAFPFEHSYRPIVVLDL